MENSKQKIIIHPAEDITGRYWAFFKDGEEVQSCNRDIYTLDEAKERVKKIFGDVEIEINGKKIF